MICMESDADPHYVQRMRIYITALNDMIRLTHDGFQDRFIQAFLPSSRWARSPRLFAWRRKKSLNLQSFGKIGLSGIRSGAKSVK